ncbi:hypothetical protein ACNJYD_10955 [Bradyrhizobium sp. DASA03005]|uniref:hypothetical protein n=1 Tax=Bradyrhizobium sp. SPXBL-02 TaxID=3395912 RepID=UPI003F6E4E62
MTISPKVGMPGGLVVLDEALRRGNEIEHSVGKPADIEKFLALNIPREFMLMIWLQPLSQSRKATKLAFRRRLRATGVSAFRRTSVSACGKQPERVKAFCGFHLRDDHELRPLRLNSMKGKRHSSQAPLPLFAIAKRA